MVNVQLNYNPYTVKTDVCINGKLIEENVSPLTYVINKRLQEWIEPKGSWPGFFKELRTSCGEKQVEIEFTGTFGDFEDLAYAKEKFGDCFDNIKLIHKNEETAKDADPYQKMLKLKELYQKLQDGPIEEFKTEDIRNNFETAVNSDFKIVIVAPMSSGKSTLINAIVGRDLLPAVNQATTAVITEIRDNDQFEDFIVNADDKYGKNVVKNEKATKEIISELNYKKDPKDPEGKEALVHLVQLEGPIPNLTSETLNTVFVDTPGGNNSQNIEHEQMMDEAINDENKSLILYVFNGAQLGTTDSNIILQKIANAMKNSTNGKQSRDRFLFVANRMDEYDISKEPYEEVIEKTILPQLESNGILEPNLFLASAQTAKLIRMVANGEKLSDKEEEDFETLIKRFNKPTRVLPKYATLNSTDKDKLIADSEMYISLGKEAENVKDVEKYKNKAAEINSGIPAIEKAIEEYLQKYAIAIKIKSVHDTFMKKVIERDMINNCEAEWAESRECFEKIKEELQEKKAKCDHSKKLQEFRNKIETIEFDITPIEIEQKKVVDEIRKISMRYGDKIKKEEAYFTLSQFQNSLIAAGKKAQVAMENVFNNGVRKSCQKIIDEYAEYISELDTDGMFNIGSFNIKQTTNFNKFKIKSVDDMMESKYYEAKKVEAGEKKEKKKGFFAAIARIFGGGYENIPIYKDQIYIDLKSLLNDNITEIQRSFDKEVEKRIKDTEVDVNKLKDETMNRLNGLDEMLEELMDEINNMLVSQEALQKKVEENAEKTKWIKEFINEVDNLLTV